VLSATVGTTAMLITALNFHQISILGEKGLSSTEAAAMFLPQVAGAVVVGLAVGALADRVASRYLLAASMALMAIALLMVPFIERGWSVVLYAVVLGATAGAQRPLAATMLPRWFGLANIGAIQGVSTFVGVGASAAGPVALAIARSLTGDYGMAAAISALLPVAMLLAALSVTEPDHFRAGPQSSRRMTGRAAVLPATTVKPHASNIDTNPVKELLDDTDASTG
jgi:MFS family permease